MSFTLRNVPYWQFVIHFCLGTFLFFVFRSFFAIFAFVAARAGATAARRGRLGRAARLETARPGSCPRHSGRKNCEKRTKIEFKISDAQSTLKHRYLVRF